MEEWSMLRGNVLDELHRHDGYNAFASEEPLCFECREDISPLESYRCSDCVPQPYYCKDCMVSAHICEPFHRVQVRKY